MKWTQKYFQIQSHGIFKRKIFTWTSFQMESFGIYVDQSWDLGPEWMICQGLSEFVNKIKKIFYE